MTAALFALTALLWVGGALATAMQAGVTPAPWSVALRMALAGLILVRSPVVHNWSTRLIQGGLIQGGLILTGLIIVRAPVVWRVFPLLSGCHLCLSRSVKGAIISTAGLLALM